MTSEEEVDSLMRAIASAPALPPPSQRSLVGTQIGNYTITRQLGRGGMGAVYAGEHPLIGKKVAVKVLHDELARNDAVVSRFFIEAKAVNDIRHENIVDVIDFGFAPNESGGQRAYLLMELLEGESLADRLTRGVPAVDDTVHVIGQAARALSAAHKKEIVHRDIKPDNIFLTARSHDPSFVKLLDFGIVKLTASDGPSWKTQTGMLIGTPLYMSPEQCAGRRGIDARSDVYSLGLVLYEMLTGRVPFMHAGLGDLLRAQMCELPAPPSRLAPDIPPGVEAAVMKCLEKEPAARFSSMDELAGTLVAAKTAPRRAAPATALAPTRVTASPSLPGTIPRRRGPRIAVVTAVVLALAAAAFVLLRGPSAPPPVAPVPAIAPTPVEIPVSTPVAEPPVAPVAPAIVEPVRAKPAAKPPKPSLHHPPPVDPKGPETLDDSLL